MLCASSARNSSLLWLCCTLQAKERPEKLLTDRSAYILYLESQLERVTAACMTVHSFEERLEDATSRVQALEEKVTAAVLLRESTAM